MECSADDDDENDLIINTKSPFNQFNSVIPCSDDDENDSDFCFDDLLSESSSIPKLQPRKFVIMACWDDELCMSEVLQHKGCLLISIGIVRNGKVYLSIEETLYLAEIGLLLLVDDKDTKVQLKGIYEKVAEGKGCCSWEHFEVFRYLKSLGYIVGRYNIPWSLKSVRSCPLPLEGSTLGKTGVPAGLDETSIAELLKDLQIREKKPFFNVYLSNSKFRKTSPRDPTFTVYLARHHPPSIFEIEELTRQRSGIPLKIVHVEHGRVSFFSFEKVKLPTLP